MKRTSIALLLFAAQVCAQGGWPTYNGDYSGRRHSPLAQISQDNVGQLTLAWLAQMNSVAIKATPLMVDGILYFTTPDNVWAMDARTGRRIWHYFRESKGDHIGNRGVGMYKNWLYFTTPDGHMVSLNAKDGTVRWDVELADPKMGYFATMAPLVIGKRIIVGVSGDLQDIPGFLDSRDPETGALQWRWYSEPKPGEPGAETWPQGTDAMAHGGGMTWMGGTYDPELNLIYWGTGNPQPVLAGDTRAGDNLYTCSIVALDVNTGKLKWHFQPSPHDTHDWDAVQTPVLFDAVYKGRQRKLLAQASRNGYFVLLDRATGEHLVTTPFIETNWAEGVDAHGQPRPKKEKEPKPDGALVNPGSDGATNWMAPSFDPNSGLFFVIARRIWSVFYMTAEGKPEGWAGRDRNLYANSLIEGIDYQTGQVRWKHELGEGENASGILTTAGNLLFTADNSDNLLALDPLTGKTLWHVNVGGRVVASPMTYELDGRQYLLTAVQGVVLAWALPERRAQTSAQFAGVYKLISYERKAANGDVTQVYGPNPVGRITYDNAGHMSAFLMRPERTSQQEGFQAYMGTYEVDETTRTVTHHVKASLIPTWPGTDLKRTYEFSGNRLILTVAGENALKLVWERE